MPFTRQGANEQVKSARHLMGTDVLRDEPLPTHPSENGAWYDSLDPVASDDVDVWVNDDGSIHLPTEPPDNMPRAVAHNCANTANPNPAAAERAVANREIERQALEYMSRKFTPAERLEVRFSSQDPRVRLAALRNLSRLGDETRAQGERQYAEHCARRKTQTRKERLRDKERQAEIKVLRAEMFQMGFHWDRYMTKKEAGEALERRDADPLYRHFIDTLVPLGLQHSDGPDATQRSWEILHKIYPDKARTGGADARILYDGDPQAELKVIKL